MEPLYVFGYALLMIIGFVTGSKASDLRLSVFSVLLCLFGVILMIFGLVRILALL